MPNRVPKDWAIPDLVDLEFFLARDADADPELLARRDRELYRDRLADEGGHSRRELLRRWLELRREAIRVEGQTPLPGEVVGAVLRPLALALFLLGALAGGGLAWGVLSYGGDQPINLFAALALLVGLPLLAALFSAVLPALRLARRGNPAGLLGRWLTGPLLARLSRRTWTLLGEGGRSGKGGALAGGWSILRSRGGLYTGVMGWLATALLQLAGLGFCLGVLVTVLLRGWFADLAFSWQTTTRVSAEQVHALVKTLATPWAAFAEPPLAHPTLEQVAGSRVYLKEGLQNLASADLQSWWAFLLWAILVYAVLPRLLLLGAARLGGWRARRRLSFHDARCEALVRRMRRPSLDIRQETVERGEARATAPELPEELQAGIARLSILVPVELLARPAGDRLQEEVRGEFDAEAVEVFPVTLDEIEDAEILTSLAAEPEGTPVLLILEGWQPCITATLEYIKALRRAIGRERLLVIGLIGREVPGRWGVPTPDQEFTVWRRRLAALGDPFLLVRNWGRPSHD